MSSIFQHYRTQKYEIQIPKPSSTLIFGSLLTFFGGVLILFGFASPYWLVSWQDTFSPFLKMGLWEFCFRDYRHPHFQFDKLFNGCHYVFSEEYRIIREWMLPGWLQTVQAFYTLALISSFGSQIVLAFLITRWPLKLILNSGWLLTLITCIGNGAAAFLLFLSVSVFGGQAFRRDWLQYPNFNYLSWGYAIAVVAMFVHALGALVLYGEYKIEIVRYREGDEALQGIPMTRPDSNPNGRGGSSVMGGMSNSASDSNYP